MALLDQITQMQSQGMPNEQIVSSLQQQGISPQQINDAISQAQIKNAVTGEQTGNYSANPQQGYAPQPMDQNAYSAPPQQYPQEYAPAPQYAAPQQQYFQEYAAPASYDQQAYSQEGYGGDQYAQAGISGTDTIIEISEQVFSEKIKKTEKQLRELTEFKNLTQTKVENFETRLKRMETIIDKLQITILEKIGSYGNELQTTRKEMGMMRESFGKVINPLVEKAKEHTEHKKATPSKKK